MPFQQTVDDYSDTEADLDDMFVQLLLQQYSTTHLPETPGYRDVKALQNSCRKVRPLNSHNSLIGLTTNVPPEVFSSLDELE
ncbi:hypothetical protein NP493_3982g00003 [Ridgeia piscesae]|uniref:Uncharacterized protein n=1 Tax=Ridgeia piscesae TaxID=27915 RepID=A0AAD9J314_RIDPI|nr:hypothetical protein NP493_3982g00003 [Ridgeia piscesae]